MAWQRQAYKTARNAWRAFSQTRPTTSSRAAQHPFPAGWRANAQSWGSGPSQGSRFACVSPMQAWSSMGRAPSFSFAADAFTRSNPVSNSTRNASTESSTAVSMAMDSSDDDVSTCGGSSTPGMSQSAEDPDTGQTCKLARRSGSAPGGSFNEPKVHVDVTHTAVPTGTVALPAADIPLLRTSCMDVTTSAARLQAGDQKKKAYRQQRRSRFSPRLVVASCRAGGTCKAARWAVAAVPVPIPMTQRRCFSTDANSAGRGSFRDGRDGGGGGDRLGGRDGGSGGGGDRLGGRDGGSGGGDRLGASSSNAKPGFARLFGNNRPAWQPTPNSNVGRTSGGVGVTRADLSDRQSDRQKHLERVRNSAVVQSRDGGRYQRRGNNRGGSAGSGFGSSGGGVGPRRFAADMAEHGMELRISAKDALLNQKLPLPSALREVLYAHRWDKVVVDVRRSSVGVKGGEKLLKFTAMVAVGNMKGLIGLGMAEAGAAVDAVAAAHLRAYGNIKVVPLYRNHTVFHTIDHKYHCLKMRITPGHAGQGVTASDILVELCNLAGIRDAHIKVYAHKRSRFFVAMCFLEALDKQVVPHDGIEGSGVYLREKYFKSGTPMAIKAPKLVTAGV